MDQLKKLNAERGRRISEHVKRINEQADRIDSGEKSLKEQKKKIASLKEQVRRLEIEIDGMAEQGISDEHQALIMKNYELLKKFKAQQRELGESIASIRKLEEEKEERQAIIQQLFRLDVVHAAEEASTVPMTPEPKKREAPLIAPGAPSRKRPAKEDDSDCVQSGPKKRRVMPEPEPEPNKLAGMRALRSQAACQPSCTRDNENLKELMIGRYVYVGHRKGSQPFQD